MPNKRTIVNEGEPGGCLQLLCHFRPNEVKARIAGSADRVVVERWGEGTSTYKPLVSTYGGFASWVSQVTSEPPARVILMTFSAGSQVAKEVCKGEELPDAIVMLDGLYGDKPKGSKSNDGAVIMDEGLTAIGRYAVSAARGERTLVITCSTIVTPYASSRECARAIERVVVEELGEPLAEDTTPDLSKLGRVTRAVSQGGFHLIELPGATGAEHERQGALHQVCRKVFLS